MLLPCFRVCCLLLLVQLQGDSVLFLSPLPMRADWQDRLPWGCSQAAGRSRGHALEQTRHKKEAGREGRGQLGCWASAALQLSELRTARAAGAPGDTHRLLCAHLCGIKNMPVPIFTDEKPEHVGVPGRKGMRLH